MIPEAYESLLTRVEKPGRYVGGEWNAVVKDPAAVRASVALAFPDVYDLGMSYHGFRILYERVNAHGDFAAERVFAPWPDYADALREAGLPLTSLENFRPLAEFDVLGFTLQHELSYTNVLEMLDLGGVAPLAAERHETFPLVVAGGEGAWSPEPMADFIDAFVVGDGEEAIFDLLEAAAEAREANLPRPEALRRLARIPGVYVPSLYDVVYHADGTVASITPKDGAPPRIERRLYDVSQDLGPTRPVVPLIRTAQNRTVVEVRRGCVNGCRFCQAGMIARPVRERSAENVLEAARRGLAATGDDSATLLSLSTADYSQIGPLVEAFSAEFGERRISISLPSLRIDAFDVALAARISGVRKSGFTFAPEAGSERLRRTINKPLDETAFLDTIEAALRAGWRTLKMYFMIGLPGETDEDLDGIVRIVAGATERARSLRIRKAQVNLTLSPFVPKAHTPFQWEGQISPAEMRRRIGYVRDRLPRKGVAVKSSPLEGSVLEAVFARGDRRLGAAVAAAWRAGCRFDAWGETFQPDAWRAAFAQAGLDPAFYAERPRDKDELLPYAHIASCAGEDFLERQRELARAGETTPECVFGPCAGCAACESPKEHAVAPAFTPPAPQRAPRRSGEAPGPVQRLRLRFAKGGALRFIAHLDFAEAVHRLARRLNLPLAHTQGFNPQPRIALAPPASLGFEALGDAADFFLLERMGARDMLDRLRSIPLEGLVWTGCEEVPLSADSIQQKIARFGYRVEWKPSGLNAAPSLPAAPETIEKAVARFLASETWPIRLMRKGKIQERDARAFVEALRVVPPSEGFEAALEMSVRAENGTTLNPVRILEALFDADPEAGTLLRTTRLPLEL